MENPNKINKFVEQFCSNSEGVLTTITNKTVEIERSDIEQFEFSRIESSIELPAILVSMNFSEDHEFQANLILPKRLVAILADLMMLGDGDVDYNPEEHNDAVQEMLNQILGSLVAELSTMDIKITASATEVEVTDMEIQKEFMIDNMMAALSINLIDEDFDMFFVMDQVALDSTEEMLKNVVDDSQEAQPSSAASSNSSSASNIPPRREQQEQVELSRPSFADMPNNNEPVTNNVNIDLLLDITLPVTVELGKKSMKIKQILELGQGSIVELDKLVGDHVELLVNGKKFALGEIMVADENLAIRVVNLISREERIRSLGE